jgi:uncharacterized membrane protein
MKAKVSSLIIKDLSKYFTFHALPTCQSILLFMPYQSVIIELDIIATFEQFLDI